MWEFKIPAYKSADRLATNSAQFQLSVQNKVSTDHASSTEETFASDMWVQNSAE